MPPALVLVACATAGATYLLAPVNSTHETIAKAAAPAGTPTAQEFAHSFVGAANAYAAAHGDGTRIANAHCVQASRAHYMCSYAATRPGVRPKCHVMQARWTPHAASTITVTLSGRTKRCRSLADALETLG